MGNTFREKIAEVGLEEPIVAEPKPTADPVDSTTPETESTPKAEEASNAQRSQKAAPSKSHRPKKGWMGKILGGDILKSQWATNQKWLVLLAAFYCLLIVSNRYYVEKLSKQKIAVEEDIKFIREQRLQMQKEYQESVKISRIAQELDSLGVGLIAGPPYEINVNEKELKASSKLPNKK